MKGKFLNKVSRELRGGKESLKKELKRVHRGSNTPYKAVVTINGVDLGFRSEDFEEFVESIFKITGKERIRFRITTRTTYIY